jgi:hypothetical protein
VSELYAITDWPLSAALVWIATRDERRADQAAVLLHPLDRAAALLSAVNQPLRRAVSLFGSRILDAIEASEERGPDGRPTGRVNHVLRSERAVEVLGTSASKVFDTVEERGPDGQPTGRPEYVMRPEWQAALSPQASGLDPVETFVGEDAAGQPTLTRIKYAGAGPKMALRRALRDGRIPAYGDPGTGRLEAIPTIEWAELEFSFDNCARVGRRALRWRRVAAPKQEVMGAFPSQGSATALARPTDQLPACVLRTEIDGGKQAEPEERLSAQLPARYDRFQTALAILKEVRRESPSMGRNKECDEVKALAKARNVPVSRTTVQRARDFLEGHGTG